MYNNFLKTCPDIPKSITYVDLSNNKLIKIPKVEEGTKGMLEIKNNVLLTKSDIIDFCKEYKNLIVKYDDYRTTADYFNNGSFNNGNFSSYFNSDNSRSISMSVSRTSFNDKNPYYIPSIGTYKS